MTNGVTDHANQACRENVQVVQCTFLVAQVQSPVFVIFMSTFLLLPSPMEGKDKLPSTKKVFTYRPLNL